jgi:VWFA-related protein
MKLADASAFLDPPASDVAGAPRPDVKTQLSILSMAVHYVANTITRLPDFYTTRVTTHFENNLSQPSTSVSGNSVELLPTGAYTRTVTYRDGKEVLYENVSKLKQEPALALTTSGEFGPILIVIVGDALHGKLQWLRWEQGAGGPVAVFSYAVPQAESHFMVGLAGKGEAQGILPAYHGEIAVDPATGAILRLSQIADMTPPHQQVKAEITVDYAPVTISGRSYICPIRGVAFSKFPVISVPTASTTTNIRGVPTYGTGDKSSWPIKAELNDVAFTNYHEFGSEARIVTNPSAGSESNAAGASGTPAPDLTAGAAAPGAGLPGTASPAGSPGPAFEEAAKTPSKASAMPNAATAATNPVPPSGATIAAASNASAKSESEAAEAATPPAWANTASEFPATQTVLHAQSKLVLVDVVVTDHGKPVTGLDRSRFHVFQDGHEQNITSFEEIGPADTSAAVVRPPVLPPDTYTNLPTYPKTSAVNVLLLDGLNTEAADQMYVRRDMIRYLKTLPPGQEIAIFTLGSKLRLIQGFTADTGKLLAALADKKAAAPASLRESPEQKAEDQAEIDRLTDAEVSPQDIANTQDFMNDTEMKQTGMRVDLTLEAFQELAHYLSAIPGRKNLVWFSGSFPLQFFAMGSDPIKQIEMNANGTFGQQVRETADLLAAERVAVYPVDARGVLGQSMFDASSQTQDYTRPTTVSPIGGGTSRFSQDTQLAALQTDTEHSSMDVLAQETGGRAVHDSNGLKEALADALSDGSKFYSVAYVPPERKTGQSGVLFHTIEVKVDGAKDQLAYRRGYYTDDNSKPAENSGRMPDAMTQAAVLGAPPSTQILFQTRVVPESSPGPDGAAPDDNMAGEKTASFPGGARRYAVDLSVPLENLTLAEGTGGAGRAQFESALVAYNDEGQVVNSLGRAFHFDLPAAQYQKLMASGGAISAHLALDLPVRDVVLRIVVYDPASAKTGSIEIPIQGADKQARSQNKSSFQ